MLNAMPSAEQILDDILMNAIGQAMIEANETPLAAGTRIGQIEVEKYGPEAATLIELQGESMLVELPDGTKTTWPTQGTVSTDRVEALYNEGIQKTVERLKLFKALGELFNGPSEEIGDDEIGGANIPTPGCDCPHCATFSAEEHEAAAKLKAEREATAAADTSEQAG